MARKNFWPALALLFFQSSAVNLLAAAASEEATNTALVELIRHSNIVNPGYKLTAAISPGEALITTQCKPKSSENERKIEAVLIAKTAFEALSDNVQRVKLLLLDYDANDCSSITVKRAEVKLFGSGGLTQRELLDSLEVTKTDSVKASSDSFVVEGPEQGARMLVLGRIEKLRSQGANVLGYMAFFKQIEDAAKAGDVKDVKTKCAYLSEKLKDQEISIKQLRMHTATAMPKTKGSVAVSTLDVAPASATFGAAPTVAAVRSVLGSSLNPSQLSSINQASIDVGMRQIAMNDKLQQLHSKGMDTSNALALCMRVQSLLYNGNVNDANVLLTKLEQQFGR